MTKEDLKKEDLQGFIGTDDYYKHWTGKLVYTDGVKYVAEKGGAHWLIDAIASYQFKLSGIPFQIWILRVDLENNTAVLTMQEDSGEPELVRQEIKFTDFPLDEIKFYLVDGVLMLPSEY